MRITALQLAARWNQPRAALDRAAALLARAPTDLALLPELAITGYVSPDADFDLAPFAEPIGGPTASALAQMARDNRCWLAGPLVEKDGARVFNTHVVFDRRGERVARYRKRHPWFPETWATAGDEPHPVIDIDGARVTLAICFDLHFLEAEAQDALAAAELMLFPSAWVEDDDSRGARFAALARRHSLAIVNANWAAGAVLIPGQGASRVVGPSARVLALAKSGEERIDAVL